MICRCSDMDFSKLHQFGYWENAVNGFILDAEYPHNWCWLWSQNVYHVVVNPAKPLIYHAKNGTQYRTGWAYLTDMGSVPVPLQGIPGLSKDGFLPAYLFHDFACDSAGLYASVDDGKTWAFMALTRRQCDDLLSDMIAALGGTVAHSIIWAGVRIGSRFQPHPEGFWMVDDHGNLTPETDFSVPPMVQP